MWKGSTCYRCGTAAFSYFPVVGLYKLMTKQRHHRIASYWRTYDARRMALTCGMTTCRHIHCRKIILISHDNTIKETSNNLWYFEFRSGSFVIYSTYRWKIHSVIFNKSTSNSMQVISILLYVFYFQLCIFNCKTACVLLHWFSRYTHHHCTNMSLTFLIIFCVNISPPNSLCYSRLM